MPRTDTIVSLLGLALLAGGVAAQDERTFDLDAVELVAGRETQGKAELGHVHGNYTYWFATEANRAEFVKNAERYQIQLGGAERLDALKTYRETHEEKVPHQGSDHLQVERLVLRFPDQVRRDQCWDDKVWATIGGMAGGFFLDEGKLRHMDRDQFAALRRGIARQPLAILMARKQDGFVCAALGRGQIAGVAVERVAVAFDGATTTLGLDPESSRIVAQSYHGRGGRRGFLGTLEVAWSDFREVGGLTLPFTRQVVSHDGQPANGKPRTLTAIDLDAELPAGCFAQPRASKL